MKAITLWRPWEIAILYGDKRIENRQWRPPASMIGARIALHAGGRFSNAAERHIFRNWPASGHGLYTDHARKSVKYAIVGLATIELCYALDPARVPARWEMGPYCWVLADVVALPKPVHCRGHQKLWTVAGNIEKLVLEQVA